jgi:aminoglycoside phosphotransferase family enzyme
MKEIPQKFRMDNLLLDGKISSRMIERLASVLAKFHRSTPTNNRIKSFGRPEFMKSKVEENFEAESTNPPEMQRDAWQAILDNFRKYVESQKS